MADQLSEYNKKRDFAKTSEPKGVAAKPRKELAFAVQHHLASRDHYDFRLEYNGVLMSWAVPKGPSYNPHDKRLAVQVEDHPYDYRTFEGTIPKGEYGGGTVMLWDEGTWEPLVDINEGLEIGDLKFVLHGKRLKGAWVLVRMKPKKGETKHNWLLIKEKDGYVQSDAGIASYTTSASTGRTMAEINEDAEAKHMRNPFERVDAELAKLVDEAPTDGEWVYEVKYDGYRIIAFFEAGETRLMTRNDNDYTEKFESIAASIARWAQERAMVLDGEVVIADDDGKTDFQALQNHLRNPGKTEPAYMVFDLLALDGEDLRDRPLTERKELLERLMNDAPDNLRYSKHVAARGEESFAAACSLKLEGVVGKRADSRYRGGRTGNWIKLKCEHRQEFVIGGYTQSGKGARSISSLLLGVYRGEKLVYVGRAGSGLSDAIVDDLEAAFKGKRRKTSPFEDAPKPRGGESFTWLKPALMAEVQFAEWTDEGLLRHPSFKGLRSDKNAHDVRREEAQKPVKKHSDGIVIGGVSISSPDKVLFEHPGITKEEVARYYEQVAPRMLSYVGDRILSIVRCPSGIASACFYKKHPDTGGTGVVAVTVPASDGSDEEYFYIENDTGIISEVQMNTLEFHVWGSRIETLEKPDTMVFDLDPDKGMALDRVREGVRDLKGLLDELSLATYLKTSGGKGYHVVVPFEPESTWDAFHDFARRIAEAMEERWPDRYTSNVRLAKRKGRIFIDWMRNGRGATSVAPYSLRARDGAPVSLPLSWDELDTVAPNDITIQRALARLDEADPWAEYGPHGNALK
ncbi:DNA ligase D [Raoultibacter phocaeensis]|uniref:DNA ligase D n=1 Tax=Raoultibacter phocaeensis TaxID=2479841 RepID=UPI00111A216F|nr:DNA ligase D [Raoultibacter phocaeensis]